MCLANSASPSLSSLPILPFRCAGHIESQSWPTKLISSYRIRHCPCNVDWEVIGWRSLLVQRLLGTMIAGCTAHGLVASRQTNCIRYLGILPPARGGGGAACHRQPPLIHSKRTTRVAHRGQLSFAQSMACVRPVSRCTLLGLLINTRAFPRQVLPSHILTSIADIPAPLQV